MVSKIIERFPNYRLRVQHALSRDRVMSELCQDYDAVISQLEHAESASNEGSVRISKAYRELSRLKLELEHEVLSRLATIQDDESNH